MLIAGQTDLELQAAFWQAFSHPIRLRVLAELRHDGPLNVGELAERLHLGQGHLSNHLSCLRSCGLVQVESRGRFAYYRVADPRIHLLLDVGAAVLQDHLTGVAQCAVVQEDQKRLQARQDGAPADPRG